MQQMKHKGLRERCSAWLPVLLWMILIFSFSAMPDEASGAQSSAVMEAVIVLAQAALGEEAASALAAGSLEFLIRKTAHFVLYLVLAVLCCRALRREGAGHAGRWALLLAAAYAATDEFHQRFVPGRSGEVRDVLIDTAGALTGLMLFRLFCIMREKHRKNRQNGRRQQDFC